MRITNDAQGPDEGPFAHLLRLQTEFQTRLFDETLRYLRHLQGALGPATPGTVLMSGADVTLAGAAPAGGTVSLTLELENLQRVHTMVTVQVTPLVADSGTTWFPATTPASVSRLLAPDQEEALPFEIPVPADVPPGTYRGALLLVGFRSNAVPLEVTVTAAPAADKKAATKTATKKAPGKKSPTRRRTKKGGTP